MAFVRYLTPVTRSTYHAFQLRRCSGAEGALRYSEEVLRAKRTDRPLVALESTIITHGMPYPHNLETALQVENIIRERGATPATIAILGGKLHIGLTEEQVKYLAQAKGVVKASRRDLAPVMASGLDGATTVAGTIIAAEQAGIPVFVTGGIGGVHREGEDTMDVSADLTELGRSRTLVVCSGVKSILDIGRTLEYLETQGVCVCAYGETNDFPAFYTARSGYKAPNRTPDAVSAAKLIEASRKLELNSGIVIAVPVPQEHAMDESIIDNAINKSLADAKSQGIKGKEVTPFILKAVAEATSGASLATNIALIKNNAKVGADIAVEFHRLLKKANLNSAAGTHKFTRGYHTSSRMYSSSSPQTSCSDDFPMFKSVDLNEPVLFIGGANLDRTFRVTEKNVKLDGTTHACETSVCGGGVARNMAEAFLKLGGKARLLTAVGDDDDGRLLSDIAPGLILEGCVIKGERTASYSSVMDFKGECLLGLGNMKIHDEISVNLVEEHKTVLERAPLVVMDGNAPQETIEHVIRTCQRLQKPVFFEPTDKRKAIKALSGNPHITFSSPNLNELRAMSAYLQPDHGVKESNNIEEILDLSSIVCKRLQFIIVTLGPRGIVVKSKDDKARFYPVQPVNSIVNVSGAGDCFSSGFIYGMLYGYNISECISMGFQAAKAALSTESTVPGKIQLEIQTYPAQYKTLS